MKRLGFRSEALYVQSPRARRKRARERRAFLALLALLGALVLCSFGLPWFQAQDGFYFLKYFTFSLR